MSSLKAPAVGNSDSGSSRRHSRETSCHPEEVRWRMTSESKGPEITSRMRSKCGMGASGVGRCNFTARGRGGEAIDGIERAMQWRRTWCPVLRMGVRFWTGSEDVEKLRPRRLKPILIAWLTRRLSAALPRQCTRRGGPDWPIDRGSGRSYTGPRQPRRPQEESHVQAFGRRFFDCLLTCHFRQPRVRTESEA